MAQETITVLDSTGASATVTKLATAEDSAHASGDVGVMILAVRQDTQAVLAADADYIPLTTDSVGNLRIAVIPGQAGIAGGTGVTGATVPRVTLATDVALPAGTNAIGKLAANSGVDIGDVDVLSLPALVAGTAAIGKLAANAGVDIGNVTAYLGTDKIRNGTTAVSPVFAAISGASSGDNTLVAAAGATNKIRVLSLFLAVAGAVNIRFESGAGGTALSGVCTFAAAGDQLVLPFNPLGWFETAADTLLNMELSGAVQVSGNLTYAVVV